MTHRQLQVQSSVDTIVLKPDVTNLESSNLQLSDTQGTVIENDETTSNRKVRIVEERKENA